MRIIFRTSSHQHKKIKLKISPFDCLKNLKKTFKKTIITVVGDGLSSAQISNYKKVIGKNNFIEINKKNNSKSLKYCIDLALGFQRSKNFKKISSANELIYFVNKNGGRTDSGQVWKYHIPEQTIELFYDSEDPAKYWAGDNLYIAPWGDLLVCEDHDDDRLSAILISCGRSCW